MLPSRRPRQQFPGVPPAQRSTIKTGASSTRMTELTSTQQQVLVLLANGRTTESAAKEVGADRNTVSYWRRTLPEFQKAFAIAQYEQTLYWREQLQQLGTLAILCIKEAMIEKSGSRNLRAAAASSSTELSRWHWNNPLQSCVPAETYLNCIRFFRKSIQLTYI